MRRRRSRVKIAPILLAECNGAMSHGKGAARAAPEKLLDFFDEDMLQILESG